MSVQTVAEKDPEFARVIAGTLAQRQHAAQLAEQLTDRGFDHVYLVGCGGSFNDFYSAAYELERFALSFGVNLLNSHEFVIRDPERLDDDCLVLLASHNGVTPETIEAAEFARERGAHTIGFTKNSETPLAGSVEDVYTYESDRTILAAKQVLINQFTYALLAERGEGPDLGEVDAALAAVPQVLDDAHDLADPDLAEVASRLTSGSPIYVVGGGPNYGVAYGMAMCYLMEMQRLDAAAYHANEFFHGAMEIFDEGTTLLAFAGEDNSRGQIERLSTFADTYGTGLVTVDARNYLPASMTDLQRTVLSPLLLSTLSKRLAEHLEAQTGHSLTERRYMFTVEY